MLNKVTLARFSLFFYGFSLFVLLFILVGCNNEPDSPVVARVGNSVLTLDELYESMPPEYSELITREQNVEYIRQWIDTEILYQEAKRQRIHREPNIRERLERMKKDLLSAEMISRGVGYKGHSVITEEDVRNYYYKNRHEFIREHDVVQYIEIVVDNLTIANQIRRTLNHENFLDVAYSRSKFPVNDPKNAPYIPLESIHPSIRNAIHSSPVPTITSPVRTDKGYHIVKVLNRLEKGDIATFDEVQHQISNYLSNYTQQKEAKNTLAELRLRNDVELNFDIIPGSRNYLEYEDVSEEYSE
ncbi:peptidylprolyl isomerase [Chitinispirillales bacterium ANBcel5]|uniref:peptidylprolyl isomerase n=1 Tax=Cellulosispirillum alkaliphilum TaxID=3039283 RepID=UPI002A54ADC0|nr:peptidylprolyl isomerase [Chitinispirillales bacterium ANBcel5]